MKKCAYFVLIALCNNGLQASVISRLSYKAIGGVSMLAAAGIATKKLYYQEQATDITMLRSAAAVEAFVQKPRKESDLSFIYVGAAWCPPCQRLTPLYELLAEAHSHEADFAKIDMTDFKEGEDFVFNSYTLETSGIPEILMFKGNTTTGIPQLTSYSESCERDGLTPSYKDFILKQSDLIASEQSTPFQK